MHTASMVLLVYNFVRTGLCVADGLLVRIGGDAMQKRQ
jgi:hypothetical protein